jgi:hypothetical protein
VTSTISVGDILRNDDPEPPAGTVVMLGDGSDEKWKRLPEAGQWCWAAQHQDYREPVWTWQRVTFDGPVIVAAVPSDRMGA